MSIEMLHLRRSNSCLSQRQRHGPPSTAAIFGSGRQVIGIGAGAIADQLCQWLGTAGQRMIQRLNHQQASALTHDETVTSAIERPRSALRSFVVAAG
ncbi:hypothetical protein D3C76_1395420 [compost metagenome]